MTKKGWLIISGLCGFTGVALGAFGAHGLKDSILPQMLEVYKTGIFYQLIHSAVLLALSLFGNKTLYKSCFFFLIGIVLFSFSLYIYALTGIKFLAMITPFGGVSFLIGWSLIIYYSIRNKVVS